MEVGDLFHFSIRPQEEEDGISHLDIVINIISLLVNTILYIVFLVNTNNLIFV
jgi:hypothetical protein